MQRIGVFVCWCGSNIAATVDVERVSQALAKEPGVVHAHVNHYNGYGADHKNVIHGNGINVSTDEFHRFGLLWTEKGYTFYVDGKEDGHSESPVSKIPQFILLTTEVNGYRAKEMCATEEARAAVGDEFVVDYVRVFDEI